MAKKKWFSSDDVGDGVAPQAADDSQPVTQDEPVQSVAPAEPNQAIAPSDAPAGVVTLSFPNGISGPVLRDIVRICNVKCVDVDVKRDGK